MRIDIISVFPEFFEALHVSLLGKAISKGLLDIHTHNLRDWTHDVHHSVDDTPIGGGAGMVMKPEVWAQCLDEILHLEPTNSTHTENEQTNFLANQHCESGEQNPTSSDNQQERPILIFPNPSAPLFTQQAATELSTASHLVFGCGRYEGYDARIPEYYRSQGVKVYEFSIGDYVLNGGEVATGVMLEAITRLIPGFMGNPDSIVEESYTGSNALLEHKQYTRPTSWRGIDVPEILLSGHHANIARYRRDVALEQTSVIRPDLIEKLHCSELDKADRKKLRSLGWEVSSQHPRKLK
ncbi:MAG: tRNA (guanosine(37)-N1)-methyltransferase TrmD [Bifidobacteriaceae bacterium]|nr:tRNA (guanosine(37)-N1)-methyltransferase TrmD [Bifidobacteriaceae bacterium]